MVNKKLIQLYKAEEINMWENCIENAYNHISLHDCVANKVQYADNILTLCFDDGFWIG